jgi:hypothetical protein
MTGVTRGPGRWTWQWDGRVAGGAMASHGTYVAALTVVSPYGTTVMRQTIVADAFSSTLSATTLAAGQRVTVRFRSAEPLASLLTATLQQAGLALAAMKVVKLAAAPSVRPPPSPPAHRAPPRSSWPGATQVATPTAPR